MDAGKQNARASALWVEPGVLPKAEAGTMVIVFIIGGMGAGKSTASRALVDAGLVAIDFDRIGHEALTLPETKAALICAFGNDVLDESGTVDRHLLAERAFASDETTAALNDATRPAIQKLFVQHIAALEADGVPAVVVEASNFTGRSDWFVRAGSIILAIVAPVELRVTRAVAAGWAEEDVRRRIAQQMTDEERIAAADVVFDNSGTPAELYDAVQDWWMSSAFCQPAK